MNKILFFLGIFLILFTGCANSNLNNSYNNIQKNTYKKNVNKNSSIIANFNLVEKMTAEQCAALFGKTLYNATSTELFCKNFMLYMKKLNENSLKFCKLYNISGLLPYQCYEIATVGYELKKKYGLKPDYQKIAKIYKQVIKKYKKYSIYSTTNLMLKEEILKTVIKRYLKGENHD